MPIHLNIFCSCLCTTVVVLNGFHKDCGLQPGSVYYLAPYRKCLLTPAFLHIHSWYLVRSHAELEVSEVVLRLVMELRGRSW